MNDMIDGIWNGDKEKNEKDRIDTIEEIFHQMMMEYEDISGIIALRTSDIYIKLKILATQIYTIRSKLEWTKKQIFPQTAVGKYLEYHAQTRGLKRKEGKKARGRLRFYVTTATKFDILIPKHTICYSKNKIEIKYETVEETKIKAGEKEVVVEAQAINEGIRGNIMKGEIDEMSNPPEYVERVENIDRFIGGRDQESDDDLRKRLLESYENISNGSNVAYYRNMAKRYEGVRSVNVIPRKRGRGTVDIIVETTKIDKELIKKMKEEIGKAREINVDIEVTEAKEKEVEIRMGIEVKDVGEYERIKDEVKKEIERYVNELGVSEGIKVAVIGAKLFKIRGLKNYSFKTPIKDVYIEGDEKVVLKRIEIIRE